MAREEARLRGLSLYFYRCPDGNGLHMTSKKMHRLPKLKKAKPMKREWTLVLDEEFSLWRLRKDSVDPELVKRFDHFPSLEEINAALAMHAASQTRPAESSTLAQSS